MVLQRKRKATQRTSGQSNFVSKRQASSQARLFHLVTLTRDEGAAVGVKSTKMTAVEVLYEQELSIDWLEKEQQR